MLSLFLLKTTACLFRVQTNTIIQESEARAGQDILFRSGTTTATLAASASQVRDVWFDEEGIDPGWFEIPRVQDLES